MPALLVIDVQRALFEKKIPIYRAKELLANLNSLLRAASQQEAPVFIVRHCNDSFLQEGTPGWQVHPGLAIPASAVFINKHHPSCFQDTPLIEELQQRRLASVVIAGLVTHGCVRASCLDALRLGYQVTLVSDGHSSFNKDAAALITVWNARLQEAGARLLPAAAVSFS